MALMAAGSVSLSLPDPLRTNLRGLASATALCVYVYVCVQQEEIGQR